MFCCLTLLCVVVCASRDGWLRTSPQQNIFNILFIILAHGKLKLKNTNVNNCILENIYIVLPLYHITSTLMIARE